MEMKAETLRFTSVLLETDTVMPFSLGMLLELLFGELGPDPGALLHAESEEPKDTSQTQDENKKRTAAQLRAPPSSSPAMSRERFLAVVMGLSRRRSSGLLLRSLTFCFSLERSFRLGSEAEQDRRNIQVLSFILHQGFKHFFPRGAMSQWFSSGPNQSKGGRVT